MDNTYKRFMRQAGKLPFLNARMYTVNTGYGAVILTI